MLCPVQDPKESLKSLCNSPRGAAVRQGLEIIEQAHQQGGAKLQLGAMGEQSSGDHFFRHTNDPCLPDCSGPAAGSQMPRVHMLDW